MTKTCSNCQIEKNLESDFYYNSTTGYWASWCRGCCLAQQRERYKADSDFRNRKIATSRKNRDPEQTRAWALRRKYGLTVEEYEEMLAEQDHACAICEAQDDLVVDHNHETGNVRALLCSSCNVGIGLLNEDVNHLRRAAEYLESSGYVKI